MTTTGAQPSAVAVLPADRLYWAILDPGPSTPSALRFRFERVLPVPVDGLQVATARLEDGRHLMAGLASQELRAHLAGLGGRLFWSLIPDRLPEHVACLVPESARERLNLLTGEFEPAPRQRARKRLAILTVAILSVLMVGLWIGIERRVSAHQARIASIRASTQNLLSERLPAGGASSLPPEARLVQERRLLERMSMPNAVKNSPNVDLAGIVDRLWTRWPRNLRLIVDTVTVGSDRILLRGLAGSGDDIETLRSTLDGFQDGDRRWLCPSPDVTRQGEDFRFLITLQVAP